MSTYLIFFFVFSPLETKAHLKCIIFFSNHLKKGKGQHLKGFNPDETYLKGTLRHILLMLDSLESYSYLLQERGHVQCFNRSCLLYNTRTKDFQRLLRQIEHDFTHYEVINKRGASTSVTKVVIE